MLHMFTYIVALAIEVTKSSGFHSSSNVWYLKFSWNCVCLLLKWRLSGSWEWEGSEGEKQPLSPAPQYSAMQYYMKSSVLYIFFYIDDNFMHNFSFIVQF